MELELWHHVYSSKQGYRTLFSSPDLPPEAAARAEEIARKLYRIVGPRPERGFYRVEGGLAAAVKGFHFGTDHAGRARTCVHTVFFRESELARLPGFTPFDLPDDLFLPDDTDLDYLSSELRKGWSAPAGAPRPTGAEIHPNWIKLLFPPLLDSVSSTVVVDPSNSDAFAMITALAHALPPALRRGLTHLDGAIIDVTNPPTFQITVCSKLPDDMTFGPDVALINLATRQSQNLPPPNAYTDFVTASFSPGGNPDDLWRFIAVLERYEADRWFALPELQSLVALWSKTRHLFRRDGSVSTTAPGDACDAVLPLYRAGAMRVSFSLLDEVVFAHVPQVAGSFRQRLRNLAPKPNETALIALVKEARKLVGIKPSADEDTNFMLPESDTIADHMMEESDDDLLLDGGKL